MPATLSMSCMTPAASSGGNASNSRNAGHKLRPDEKRQPHPGHARSAELDDGGDEIHCAQQRRGNQQHHADEPEVWPLDGNRPSAMRAANKKSNQPCAAPPGIKKLTNMITPPRKNA